MKICLAQARPIKGNIAANIKNHEKLIGLAASYEADLIVFPELSLTGYEPELAKELAMTPDDTMLDVFQQISDSKNIIIGAGVPTPEEGGVMISMVIFQPLQPRQTYTKQYLHGDEEPFFVAGQGGDFLTFGLNKIALAICYELSVPEHAENAAGNKAAIYIASSVKDAPGIEKSSKRLAEIAATYSMTVLHCNCVGESGGYACAGHSSVWDHRGNRVGQLDDIHEGILIVDTDTLDITRQTL